MVIWNNKWWRELIITCSARPLVYVFGACLLTKLDNEGDSVAVFAASFFVGEGSGVAFKSNLFGVFADYLPPLGFSGVFRFFDKPF